MADRLTYLGVVSALLHRLYARNLARRTERFGVTPGQFAVFAVLMDVERCTQAELSQLAEVEQPTMAVTLKRMERDGLIVRHPDPTHGRRQLIELSPQAREVSDNVVEETRKLQALATEGLSRKEVAEFMRVAGVMIENLRESATRPPDAD